MNDFLKQTIKRLVQEHGDYLYSDINRLRGMLYDACPSYRKEINVLLSVVQAELIADLKRTDVSGAYLHSLSNRLYNETGIDRTLAEWGIKIWAEALGIEVPPTTFYCSFCDKSQHEVHRLFAKGKEYTPSTIFICDQCIELCFDINHEKKGHLDNKDEQASQGKKDVSGSFYCSFCGKSQHEVYILIAGPAVFICDGCVEECVEMVKEKQGEIFAAKLYEMETSKLQSNPLSPRVITPDSLTDLVESIREQGILEPIVVAKTSAGLQIIAGERRWRAAKILGMKKVPVVVKETTPQGMLEMSIVENIQREDLNPIEKALTYRRLIDEYGLETTEVAKRVGKSVPAVSNAISLLALPDSIRDALVCGVVTEGHVRPLLSLGNKKLMLNVFKTILEKNYTVQQTEKYVQKTKGSA